MFNNLTNKRFAVPERGLSSGEITARAKTIEDSKAREANSRRPRDKKHWTLYYKFLAK